MSEKCRFLIKSVSECFIGKFSLYLCVCVSECEWGMRRKGELFSLVIEDRWSDKVTHKLKEKLLLLSVYTSINPLSRAVTREGNDLKGKKKKGKEKQFFFCYSGDLLSATHFTRVINYHQIQDSAEFTLIFFCYPTFEDHWTYKDTKIACVRKISLTP